MIKSKTRLGKIAPYLVLLPAVLYMILFIGYPLVYNLILSFQNVSLSNLNTGDISFLGLENYRNVLNNATFWIALRNTFTYTILSIIFQFTIGFGLAIFFSKRFKGNELMRGMIMVAWLIPLTVTALLFRFMLGSESGIMNQLLLTIGMIDHPIQFLSSTTLSLYSIIFANIWVGIPFNMLLISTGLSNLPNDIYESASLDGATAFQKFFHITLPLMKPVLLIVIMQGFIYTFKVFDLVFVMTGGGPINSTEVLSTFAYRQSFGDFQFSLGATTSNILFIIMFIISLYYLFLNKKESEK